MIRINDNSKGIKIKNIFHLEEFPSTMSGLDEMTIHVHFNKMTVPPNLVHNYQMIIHIYFNQITF